MSSFLRKLKFNISYILGNAPWDSGISPPELFDFIANHPAGHAIDIGCGTGTNVITLAKAGWQATGFDFSPLAIQKAKEKVRNANIQASVFVDDATQMRNVNGTFDLALDLGCFHSIPNKKDYLTQLTRILASNGYWLMYGFLNPNSLQTGPCLAAPDLDLIQRFGLTLLSRNDGFDKRERTSAWFLYQRC